MKQILKTLLFNKRIQNLKSRRGFSLLEVLIAVAIIGIISAIAVPQFADQRANAAKVASDTSASNIAKAFQNCAVLNSFANCSSLGDLKVSCPGGSACISGGTSPNFCAHLKRGTPNQDDFNVCVSVNATTGVVTRTYGGELIKDHKVCHQAISGCTNNSHNKTKAPVAGLKDCTVANAVSVCGAATVSGSPSAGCTTANTCEKPTGQSGTCSGGASGTGLCS